VPATASTTPTSAPSWPAFLDGCDYLQIPGSIGSPTASPSPCGCASTPSTAWPSIKLRWSTPAPCFHAVRAEAGRRPITRGSQRVLLTKIKIVSSLRYLATVLPNGCTSAPSWVSVARDRAPSECRRRAIRLPYCCLDYPMRSVMVLTLLQTRVVRATRRASVVRLLAVPERVPVIVAQCA
jgi:hypothetical protein